MSLLHALLLFVLVPLSFVGPIGDEKEPDASSYHELAQEAETKTSDKQQAAAVFSERLFKFINEREVERLVIGMNWNGGNFLNKPLVQDLIRVERTNQRGKPFVIIRRNTFSPVTGCAMEIERYANAIFVGEPAGSNPKFVGETVGFELTCGEICGGISDLYWQSSVAMDYGKTNKQ